MKLAISFVFLVGSLSVWAGAKKEVKKEETVTLTCQAGACPDLAGYNGFCSSAWVANTDKVPPNYAVGKLPECKCTPTKCDPNTTIRAVGYFELDPSLPADMDVVRFNVKSVLKK